ncbi:hypothetical protein [Algibacter sp. L4_22]|uniref:hypothetical protein n=1 Tax=Algibacter sp. L4_22 TaxID=2942477 RepID=UPI00201B68B7|nr:hypothetical protein [Algibacter sp. L4_22]MCL5129922.1 hypothetical protein [Algibacter sp. L4_22]
MKFLSLLKSRTEHLEIDLSIDDLKKRLNSNGKTFHFNWQYQNDFIISLNFSFGSNKLFDINYHNTKSDIIANGTLKELTKQKTQIILETKSKYWLTFLLIIPAILFIVNLFLKLWILVPLYFFFPLFLMLILNIMDSEEKRLIRNFKTFLSTETNTLQEQNK